MNNLPIPLKDIDIRTIFYECADALQNKTALSYIEDVVLISKAYEEFVPKDIIHLPQCDIKNGDEKEIIKVYTDKFAKKGSVGKKYYEAIIANANGRCPICGSGKLKNLDHYLPKSLYPILCVTPINLVPLCRDCNFDKNNSFDTDYYTIPFNPYFDAMQELWLECSINFLKDNTVEVSYINGYNKAIDEKIWRKYETHLKVFDLNATFAPKACEEIDNCKGAYQELLRECGVNSLKNALAEHKTSCEKRDINSWKAALYRELLNKLSDFCMWLEL